MKLVSCFGLQLIILLVTSSCRDESIDFEQEVILVGIDSTASTIDAFDLIFNEGLTIERTIGFTYETHYPVDSLDFIDRGLKSKSYLKTDTLTLRVVDSSLEIKVRMLKMGVAENEDWFLTMDELKLYDVSTEIKWITVSVPPGSEESWVKLFSKKNDVVSASLIRNPTADN